MNMHWIDWGIVFLSVVILRFVSMSARSHCKGVADFLSANRSAGRYLLSIAGSMGSVGTISFVALFEVYFLAGFPPIWWGFLSIPIGVIILMIGRLHIFLNQLGFLTVTIEKALRAPFAFMLS